ncbi:DUF7668 domain-containing protein [Leisingera sp. ANG-DT]|uniref:DUF7668 domain-containing protein n=1 Tax=Leisingera sp. ANG-DT TaxID=1577897 RepID=UPI0005804485|nr:hypothetical protein [Leisingera sp. ANG-DT]
MSENKKISVTTRLVVQMLVEGDFDSIEKLSGGNRLSAADISSAVEEYGRTLISPPEESYSNIDAVQIEDELPSMWSVRFHLWTEEEGQSDLSIVLTLSDIGRDLMRVDFDGILVL